jgi:hypothetical protein
VSALCRSAREDLGDVVVAHPLKADEEDHLALFVRQVGECAFEVSQLQCGDGIGLNRQLRRLSHSTLMPSRTP